METSMSLWTTEDYLLAGEWGLNLPDAQPNGHYGDLKVTYDLSNSASAQDAVGGIMSNSPTHEEDLGLEWMESSDLGSYLDLLGGFQEKLLPIESALSDLNPFPPTDPGHNQITKKEDLMDASYLDCLGNDHAVDVDTSVRASPAESAGVEFATSNASTDSPLVTSFDALLSPPRSPVQVAPVIEIAELRVIKTEKSPIQNEEVEEVVFAPSWDVALDDGTSIDNFMNQDLILSELDLSSDNGISDNSYVDLADARMLISSPLSVNDVEDTLASPSISSPSSPDNTKNSCQSIIDTCPELFKVISTSSIQLSATKKRFSPYQKSNSTTVKVAGTKAASKSGRKRAPAEPVPEHVIVQQVNKKDRKKLQNKNAAIRYRMKKKEEAKGIKSEEETLEEINTNLKTKVDDLEREIRYMKNLMEEVYKAKGII